MSRFGKVASVRLPPDSLHQRSHRGYGFVTFEDADSAREAVNKGVTLEGKQVQVDYARDNAKSGGGGGGPPSRYRPYAETPQPYTRPPPTYPPSYNYYVPPPVMPAPVEHYQRPDPYYSPYSATTAPSPYSYNPPPTYPPYDPREPYRSPYVTEPPRKRASPPPLQQARPRAGEYYDYYYNPRPTNPYEEMNRDRRSKDITNNRWEERRGRRSPSPIRLEERRDIDLNRHPSELERKRDDVVPNVQPTASNPPSYDKV